MKYVIIALLCLCNISGCVNQNNENNKEYMNENLDVKRLERKGKKTVYDNGVTSYYWEYKEKDGTKVIITGDREDGFTECRIPENAYYEIYKEYYPNGMFKQKGSLFGEHTKIGTWYYYDNQSNQIETVNEGGKFGKFGYIEVLDFLIKNNYVAKDSYEGISKIKIVFSVEDQTWHIRVIAPGYLINDYTINGNTGEIEQHNVFQGGKM